MASGRMIESECSLHSTMFLLIRITVLNYSIRLTFFTFHNVSINTRKQTRQKSANYSLHSTMFLLIHEKKTILMLSECSLHSTMFLLILLMAKNMTRNYCSLHSTMFLLIQTAYNYCLQYNELYIPQCFY